MAIWSAPTNKNDSAIVAGPTSAAQTLTLGTPLAHSVLICLVAWTGAQTIAVTDSQSNSWLSKTQIDNGSNHCQIWYVLNANGSGAVTITATPSGSITNFQFAAAEYPVNVTKIAITAASQSGSVTTYTCSISEGVNLVALSRIVITGMADAGNNSGGSNPAAFVIQTTNGTTSFTVNNINGVTRAVQSGIGITSQTQGLIAAVVDIDAHTATGSSTTPSSGVVSSIYDDELWIGYADNGTSSTWTAGTTPNYTLRSTAAARRAAIEDILNAQGPTATAKWTNTSNTAWEAGAITFQVQSIGTGYTVPSVEKQVTQAALIAATNTRFGGATDPYGAGPTGAGANKAKGGQIGIAKSHVGKLP